MKERTEERKEKHSDAKAEPRGLYPCFICPVHVHL
jgi:hypothetical protein